MYNPNYDWVGAPMGWRCPVCGRVYSPTTPMCFYCDNQKITYRSEINTTDDSKWWEEYLKQSQTGKSANDNPSATTATATSNPNSKVTAWNSTTTCEQKCGDCDKYEKSCFGGIETMYTSEEAGEILNRNLRALWEDIDE